MVMELVKLSQEIPNSAERFVGRTSVFLVKLIKNLRLGACAAEALPVKAYPAWSAFGAWQR